MCATYIKKPVYGATSTDTISSTATSTKTFTPSTTTTQTVKKGTAQATILTTTTGTVSSAFGTDTGERVLALSTIYIMTMIYFQNTRLISKPRPGLYDTVRLVSSLLITCSHTTTTIPVTTIYTQTTHIKARRALSTFPPPLPAFTSILSSACSSLLASHTSTAISTTVSTITVTQTAPTATATHHTTVPVTTITRTSTGTTTTTVVYLAYATTTTTLTITTTLTSTKYASTTRVPAQCAPTAYVINAHEYTDESINFADPTTQADALTCCELCVSTPNCQAWIFYTEPPGSSSPGTCSFVTGATAGTCPAADFNSGFVPICADGDGEMFNIGLGACTSDISLTGDGCFLGENQ